MSDFLADCAERIIVLGIVHRRVMNRYVLFIANILLIYYLIFKNVESESTEVRISQRG